MNNLIYVPDDSYSCYEVVEGGNIKAYETMPQANENTSYRLYYSDNHYIYSDLVQYYESDSVLPICLSSSVITTDFYYRNDLSDILVCFLIFSIFIIYIPLKVFVRWFRRFQ